MLLALPAVSQSLVNCYHNACSITEVLQWTQLAASKGLTIFSVWPSFTPTLCAPLLSFGILTHISHLIWMNKKAYWNVCHLWWLNLKTYFSFCHSAFATFFLSLQSHLFLVFAGVFSRSFEMHLHCHLLLSGEIIQSLWRSHFFLSLGKSCLIGNIFAFLCTKAITSMGSVIWPSPITWISHKNSFLNKHKHANGTIAQKLAEGEVEAASQNRNITSSHSLGDG